MLRTNRLLALAVLVLCASAPALAQKSDAPAPSDAEIARADECRDLVRTSKRLRGQLKNDLRYEIQQEDATFTMKNKKHVVLAYAALLILLVGFVVLLYLRQQTLLAEISRLERDVRAAAAEDGDSEE